MSSITHQKVGKYTYLYESNSYWDAEHKRPDNNKTCIGTVDLYTGKPMYTREYLERLESSGVSTEGMKLWVKRSRNQESPEQIDNRDITPTSIDDVRDFGVVYFLTQLAESIGLLKILREEMPTIWNEVFCLACYLVAEDKPVMYCEDWVESNEGLNTGSMSSQRISDFLASIDYNQRNRFYRSWYRFVREREYVALDITSISSYSEQITACEWGYNRDNEALPQINVCMLTGELSKLPAYQTLYSGSLRDVSTLKATIDEFFELTDAEEIMLVTDKGFFSKKNIDMLLSETDGKQRFRFLMSVPFTSNFPKGLIEKERRAIDSIDNVITTNDVPIRGVHRVFPWAKGKEIHAHIFYDPERALKTRNELYNHVTSLVNQAKIDPDNKKLAAEYKKYLNMEGRSATIRKDVVEKALETSGWFVLISNDIADAQTAYDTYRAKDVVEKSFWKYKNALGLDRLRVHSDERVNNKLFIAFIALILTSIIYNTLKEKDLLKCMTFDKMILTLAKLKIVSVNGKKVMRPVTKEQMTIFDAFEIQAPEECKAKIPQSPKRRGRKAKVQSKA